MSDSTQLERSAVLAEMQRLFREYELYDLTVDVLAAWQHHLAHYYQEAYVDLVSSLGRLGKDGCFQAVSLPDFTVSFVGDHYGLIGEVKASLSIGDESLNDLIAQLHAYDADDHAFRLDPDGRRHHVPSTQDILLIVPSESAAAVAQRLSSLIGVGSDRAPFRKNVLLCQFSEQGSPGRVLFFSRFPVQGLRDSLRDGFLPTERRLSSYLDRRIELRSSDFAAKRDYVIAGSDRTPSELGILSRVFPLVERFYGDQLRVTQYSEHDLSRPISFNIEEFVTRIRKAPYVCRLSAAALLGLLTRIASSASFVQVEDNGVVRYTVPRQKRFSPFRSEDILPELPRKHAHGSLPVFCYHLARASLLAALSPPAPPGKRSAIKQLPLHW